MHYPFNFGVRVLALIVLMSIAVIIDLARHGRKAAKYLEYAFVLLTGMIAALAGVLNDLVTSQISPEYFIYGKGLAAGGALRLQAAYYGLQAGFAAGVVGGAICLFATVENNNRFPFGEFVWQLWMPLASAVACAFLFPIVAGKLDPLRFAENLTPLLSPLQITRFRLVWWIHTGLYAGMIIGLGAMIIRRRRAQTRSRSLGGNLAA